MTRLLCIFTLVTLFSLDGFCQADTLTLYFRQGQSSWDPAYRDNGPRLLSLVKELQRLRRDSAVVLYLHYRSAASPEGSVALNRRLSGERARVMTGYLGRYLPVSDSLAVTSHGEDWAGLRSLVSSSTLAHREPVLAVLDRLLADPGLDDRLVERYKRELMSLSGGEPWASMLAEFFPRLRYFKVRVTVTAAPSGVPVDTVHDSVPLSFPSRGIPLVAGEPFQAGLQSPAGLSRRPLPVPFSPDEAWSPRLHLKTNVVALGLLVLNLSGEVELSERWSVELPVYYSGANYFRGDVKFRVFSLYPGARYYIPGLKGVFAGVHAGLAYFNFAGGGKWRYQDHDRETPAVGGGLSAGFRFHPWADKRWGLELSAGVGIYKVHLDKFRNEPDGKLVDSVKKTYTGVDNLSLSLTYTIDLKRGGKR